MTDDKTERRRVFSDAPWEELAGYCRAIECGGRISVTGTAPIDEDGSTHAPGDATAQTRRCLELIEDALEKFGADRSHIVRTRIFVTDITRWEEFGAAHADFFGTEVPATTMVEVSRLIDEDMLVEIEAEAVL